MFCPTCGRDNPKKAQFCIQCGRQLPTRAAASSARRRSTAPRSGARRSSSGLLIALVAAIALVLVLILGALAVLVASVDEGEGIAAAASTATAPVRQGLVPAPGATTTLAPAVVTPAPVSGQSPATVSGDTPSAAVTPIPAATPGPSPTPTSAPPSATPKPSATATSAAAPKTSPPRCRNAQKGLIGFKRQRRCDKQTGNACGPVEIWVMDADGSNQAPMCNRSAYDRGLVRDRTSPDGKWRVEVSSGKADIMRLYLDTGKKEMIIVNNRKDWDPVLSADGWWLAWVTNRNANDEIYIKTIDWQDQNQRRLTVNDWEWDKHPTWSPGGTKIAFYSNRANKLSEATRQIWVMDIVNDRGANLRNLSHTPDRVDTDPVWFKWDEMP